MLVNFVDQRFRRRGSRLGLLGGLGERLSEARESLAQRGKALRQFVGIERHGGEIDSSKGRPEPVKNYGTEPDCPGEAPSPGIPR